MMHGICRDAPSLTAHFHVCTACGRPGHSVQACSEAGSGGSSWSGWRVNHVVPGGSSWGNLSMQPHPQQLPVRGFPQCR